MTRGDVSFADVPPTDRWVLWQYALIGGLLAAPFTALEVWRSPESITLEAFVLDSVLAGRFGGWLAQRRGHGRSPVATGRL